MKASYGEGVATHTDSESCVGLPQGGGEALTGARTGRVWSREIAYNSRVPTPWARWQATPGLSLPRDSQDPARAETSSKYENTSHGSREIPGLPAGRGSARPHREV